MFSNNIMSFIILNIYLLLIIDIGILIVIYYLIFSSEIKSIRYTKYYESIKSFVLDYIENKESASVLNKRIKSKFNKEVVMDIMLEYSKQNAVSLSDKFEEMAYDKVLINKINKKISLDLIRKLALMRTNNSFETLNRISHSDDFETSYMSFYALSLLELDKEQIEIVIENLIKSDLVRDRIIEIINNFDLSFEEYMELLEKQQLEVGKVIFLKLIHDRPEIFNEKNTDKMVKYLSYSKEVKIAAVLLIAATRNEKYLSILFKMYEEESWEIRAAIIKGLKGFKIDKVRSILIKAVYDKAWWVRFNAGETLITMGVEGIEILIDLSLDDNDRQVSDLAYYFLNANKGVYKTVKDIEV